eukprot:TRINITY_DN16331_c0_g1_i1.p2 TRINITY_DN16331_c0_g1~~TRINITY_DN16331_c0_g1_i1.p2  ORF type:complete len:120 (+),score=40.93 TRINITY_DN16331_c0_g1_i1:92-451(+)
MIRRPPRSTHCISSAASDVYKRQVYAGRVDGEMLAGQRGLTEFAGQLPGVTKAARQLVWAEQEIGDGELGLATENMGAELHGQRLQGALGQRAGGDGKPMYSALIPCLLYTSPSPRDQA